MRRSRSELVLAIHPFTRGLSFALFEGPLTPVDWGFKLTRNLDRNAYALAEAERIMERLQPDVLILEECVAQHARRAPRVARLSRLMESHARGQSIEVQRFSRPQIRDCFKATGAITRYEIAQVLASHIPAFEHLLPAPRKKWVGEPTRASLFDAVALVVTFYFSGSGLPAPASEVALPKM